MVSSFILYPQNIHSVMPNTSHVTLDITKMIFLMTYKYRLLRNSSHPQTCWNWFYFPMYQDIAFIKTYISASVPANWLLNKEQCACYIGSTSCDSGCTSSFLISGRYVGKLSVALIYVSGCNSQRLLLIALFVTMGVSSLDCRHHIVVIFTPS